MISTELGCKGHKVSGSRKILWGVTWFSERTVGGISRGQQSIKEGNIKFTANLLSMCRGS